MSKARVTGEEDWTHLTQEWESTTGVVIVQITKGRVFKGNLRAICGDCESMILWDSEFWKCTGELCKRDYSKIVVGAAVCHENSTVKDIKLWVSIWTGISTGQLTVKVDK